MQKKLKKAARILFASGLAVLVLLGDVKVGNKSFGLVQTAKASGENDCTFYQGYSMATIDVASGYTLSGSFTLQANAGNGLTGTWTISASQTGIFMKCCMDNGPNSACNFANEYGGSTNPVNGTSCRNAANRPGTSGKTPFCP